MICTQPKQPTSCPTPGSKNVPESASPCHTPWCKSVSPATGISLSGLIVVNTDSINAHFHIRPPGISSRLSTKWSFLLPSGSTMNFDVEFCTNFVGIIQFIKIFMQKFKGFCTLGDARSFSGLTSKIPPLGSMLNFDADVKKTTARHQGENRLDATRVMIRHAAANVQTPHYVNTTHTSTATVATPSNTKHIAKHVVDAVPEHTMWVAFSTMWVAFSTNCDNCCDHAMTPRTSATNPNFNLTSILHQKCGKAKGRIRTLGWQIAQGEKFSVVRLHFVHG